MTAGRPPAGQVEVVRVVHGLTQQLGRAALAAEVYDALEGVMSRGAARVALLRASERGWLVREGSGRQHLVSVTEEGMVMASST